MKRDRKPWRWVAGALALCLVCVIFLFAFRRDPYAFLNRFHPRVVRVDANNVAGLPLGAVAAKPTTAMRTTMLVFRTEDATAILKAMKEELVARRGFLEQDLAGPQPLSPNDVIWEFAEGSLPSSDPSAPRTPASMYASGYTAAEEEAIFEKGLAHIEYEPDAPKERNACIVVLVHEENWMDNVLDKCRGFLHLD